MGSEHIVRADDPRFIPLARSSISAMRASGMQFGTKRFVVDGVSITVKIAGDQSFISVESQLIVRPKGVPEDEWAVGLYKDKNGLYTEPKGPNARYYKEYYIYLNGDGYYEYPTGKEGLPLPYPRIWILVTLTEISSTDEVTYETNEYGNETIKTRKTVTTEKKESTLLKLDKYCPEDMSKAQVVHTGSTTNVTTRDEVLFPIYTETTSYAYGDLLGAVHDFRVYRDEPILIGTYQGGVALRYERRTVTHDGWFSATPNVVSRSGLSYSIGASNYIIGAITGVDTHKEYGVSDVTPSPYRYRTRRLQNQHAVGADYVCSPHPNIVKDRFGNTIYAAHTGFGYALSKTQYIAPSELRSDMSLEIYNFTHLTDGYFPKDSTYRVINISNHQTFAGNAEFHECFSMSFNGAASDTYIYYGNNVPNIPSLKNLSMRVRVDRSLEINED